MSRSSEQRVALHQPTRFSARSQVYFRLLDDLSLRLFAVKVQGHARDVDQRKDHGRETDGRVLGGGKPLRELRCRGEHHFSNVWNESKGKSTVLKNVSISRSKQKIELKMTRERRHEYRLLFDCEPATLKATHGVKTPGSFDFWEASLHTSLAVTTRPSAASLNPVSPIHCNNSKIILFNEQKVYRVLFFMLIYDDLLANDGQTFIHHKAQKVLFFSFPFVFEIRNSFEIRSKKMVWGILVVSSCISSSTKPILR